MPGGRAVNARQHPASAALPRRLLTYQPLGAGDTTGLREADDISQETMSAGEMIAGLGPVSHYAC